jgi:hypothetical protein
MAPMGRQADCDVVNWGVDPLGTAVRVELADGRVVGGLLGEPGDTAFPRGAEYPAPPMGGTRSDLVSALPNRMIDSDF